MDTKKNKQAKSGNAAYTLALIASSFLTASWASASTLTVCSVDCDYSSLQAAIDAATAGDVIEVAAGDHVLTTTLNLRKADITIAGAGQQATTIDASAVNGYGLSWTANNVTLRDLRIVGPASDAGTRYGIKVQPASSAETPVRGVRITRVTVEGSGRTEIDLHFVDDATLTDVTASGQGTAGAGIAMISSTNVVLDGIITSGNNWGGVAVYTNASIHFTDSPTSADIAIYDLEATESMPLFGQGDNGGAIDGLDAPQFTHVVKNSDHRANGSQFTYHQPSQESATAFALALEQPQSSVVQSASDEEGLVFLVGSGMSLQAAITAAPSGALIEVLNGTYAPIRTSIGGPEDITIRAAAGHTPVISGTTNPKRILDLRADGTVVDGFQVIAPDDHVAISIVGRGLLIQNNTVTAGLTGIMTNTQYLHGENIIRNNTVSGVTAGISLQNASNEVTGNSVAAGVGVGNYGTVDNESDGIRGNLVENNAFQGKASVWRTGEQLDLATGTALLNAVLDNNTLTGPVVTVLTPDNNVRPSVESISGADINNFRLVSSIQAGIDIARPGDTVGLNSATFEENVEINKSITLSGLEAGAIIAPATGRAISIMGNTAPETIEDVNIEGLTVHGNAGEFAIIALSNADDSYNTSNFSLKDIVIESDPSGFGIGLFDVDGADLGNVRILGHTSLTVGALELVGVKDLAITGSDLGTSSLSLHVFEAAGYMANGNITIQNSKLGVAKAVGATVQVDARSNWWGRTQGPTAETVGNVQFTPWFVNLNMTLLSSNVPGPGPVTPPTPTPVPDPIQEIVTTITVPEDPDEPITQETVTAVEQAANTAQQVAATLAQNPDTVTTSQAVSALGSIGNVVRVSGAAAQNTAHNGNAAGSASTGNSGSSALNSFSSVLTALDQKNRRQNTELTTQEKTSVQSAALTAVSSAVTILAAIENPEQKKSVLSNLGRIISSSVNLGVPLSNEQGNALLTATEQTSNPDADIDEQLETSIPLKPLNKALISRDDIVAATGLGGEEIDEFLAELALAINPADISIGGISGQDSIDETFAASTGGSVAFDPTTGTLFFAIPSGIAALETSDGRTVMALSSAEIMVPTRLISSNVVSSNYPEGMRTRADGAIVIASDRIASVIVPAPYDAIGFHADMRAHGLITHIRENGNVIVTEGPYTFSGTFDFTGIRADGIAGDLLSFNNPAGGDESDLNYAFEITYRDGTRQTIQPYVAAPTFVATIRSYGMTISISRDNGVVTVDGTKFRPGYLVAPHNDESQEYWELYKDESGIAFQALDVNGDGKMDYRVLSDAGVQIAYGL